MGHYATLNISHRASQDEIRLAYVMLKQAHAAKGKTPPPDVREAYETLRNPRERQRYDAGPPSALSFLKRPDGTSRLDSVPLLIGLVAVLAVALYFTVVPIVKVHYMQYEVGDQLLWTSNSTPFGTIIKFEEAHSFEDGSVMAAYQIRPADGEAPDWHSTNDIHRYAAPAFD